ncbi:MAG: tetratricopeptide repeat protein [Spirochaetales bacterium]|nr:tetratricopeptide repeat protein [Spirochaetales bacterium]
MKKILIPVICLLLCIVFQLFSETDIEAKFKEAGQFYSEQQYDEALKILDELKKEKISNEKLFYYYGMIYYETDRMEDAELNFRKAIEINPEFAPPHIEMGVIMINKRKLPEAKKYCSPPARVS